MKIYTLQVVTGQENRIKDAIMHQIENEGLQDKFGEIIVPTEEVTEYRDGEKRKVKRKHFPGYIFIQMETNDELFVKISRMNVTGIKGFVRLGNDHKPSAVVGAEADRLLGNESKGSLAQVRQSVFSVGQNVIVKDGPFKDFPGVVEELNHEKQRVKVSVMIFGRSTPVELEFFQIEAAN